MEKKSIEVLGHTMTYVEQGTGNPIIFQHGNPTSSYLWRNILPKVSHLGRCIALDLIGMGDSQKLENSDENTYTFAQHYEFFEAALAQLGVTENVTLVIHDWGSALGFHWANQHRDAVAGICYMEAITGPMASWDEFPESARPVFQGFRSEAGESMVLENNLFVERVLPGSIMREMSDEEMAEYRRPFAEPGEGRRPTLTWPRQIPIGGEPADVTELAANYHAWLKESEVPKLFINAEPGAILTGKPRERCREFPNQTEVTVAGSHFIQEDSPDEIAAAIVEWMSS